jgi:hypothetical protein
MVVSRRGNRNSASHHDACGKAVASHRTHHHTCSHTDNNIRTQAGASKRLQYNRRTLPIANEIIDHTSVTVLQSRAFDSTQDEGDQHEHA